MRCFGSFWLDQLFIVLAIAEGAANEAVDASSPGSIGANDLLIVGPGVLGKLVAEKWREV